MEKMTYVKALETVLTPVMAETNPEVYEKLTGLKSSLEKRSLFKKETKAQREAKEFTDSVFKALVSFDVPVKCGDLAKVLNVSGQKVSAALTKLVKAGLVVKITNKGSSVFMVAGPDSE